MCPDTSLQVTEGGVSIRFWRWVKREEGRGFGGKHDGAGFEQFVGWGINHMGQGGVFRRRPDHRPF